MSSNQEWSEALEAGLHNTESFANNTFNNIEQDAQADYFSTPYDHSPQASPDSQQIHLSPAQHCPGFGSNSQDKHMSQSCTLLPNTSPVCEQQNRNEQIIASELESQQTSNTIPPPGQNESNGSSNYSVLRTHLHSPEYSHKNQLQSNTNNSQADSISNLPAGSTRQLQNHPSNHHQVHLSAPHQPNQARSYNVSTSHLPAAQIVSPPNQTALQHARQNIPRQIQPRQPYPGGGQNAQSAQQRMPRQHQTPQQPHHNLMNAGSSSAANMYPNNNMATPTLRPHSKAPAAGQMQTPVNMPGRALQSPAPVGNNNSSVGRLPQQQGHPPTYQQGMAQHKQEGESNERMPQEPHPHQYRFEGEHMYYGEEDGDEDMDDVDDERMEYAGFPGRPGYNYPSSDSEELSEEESALLEELRCCEDDERYDEIVSRLQEKGVDPEEIDEMLYQSSYPPGMYPGVNYNDEDGDGGEAEGAVSSSSQGQTHYMRNQMRPHAAQAFPAGGQHPPRMYSAPPSGQNKKDLTSAVSSVHDQQSATVPSVGYNNQDSSQGVPLVFPGGAAQQRKTSGLQTSDSCLSAGIQTSAQGEVLPIQQQPQQQQSKQLSLGLGNQQKQVLQGGTLETCQSTFGAPQANNWQPLQNVIRAQTQMKSGDPRQSSPKGIPQPSQSPGMQSLRPGLSNRPPQPHSQAQGQIGVARPQGTAQSSPSGVVVRPVQHLTIITNNSQSLLPGQGPQNRFVMKQTTPAQQFVISSVPQSQQSSFVGTSSQALSPVKTTCPRAPLQTQQKAQEQPGLPEMHVMTPAQQQGVQRSATSVPQGPPHQQNSVHSPQLRAVLNKDTAPSEARLARLNVMYMQQKIDQEILARKGTQPAQVQSSGAPNVQTSDSIPHNRLPPPHNTNLFATMPTDQQFPQKQQSQNFPAYQPKHQLPPRQPIPAIVNPNSNTNQTFSSGRPICSVVPFTSQNRGQAVSPNVLRQNAPQQNANFVRPRNPAVLSAQNVGSSPQHVGGGSQLVSGSPLLVSGNPQHVGGNAQHVGGNPQLVSGNPQLVSGNPQLVSGNPQHVAGNPQHVGGNPQHVDGNPQHVDGNPQHVGGNPQHVGGNPQYVGGNPQHVGGNPQLVGENPQHVSGNPQHVGGNPQHVGGNPQHVGGNPQLVGGNPQYVGGNPQHIGGNPQHIGGNPQHIGLNPQLIGGNLQLVGGNPQHVGGNPQHVGSSPQLIGGSPQLIGGNPQLIGGNPQQVGGNSQHFGSSPQHFGSSPQHFVNSPQHAGSVAQHAGSVAQQSPGTLQIRMSVQLVTHASSPLPAGHNIATTRIPAQGNVAFPKQGNIALPVYQQLMPDQLQQPQLSSIKPEAFCLDQLSEDKCVVAGKGKQQLTVNMVYQIRSPKDNSLILALWNGERFEDLKQSDIKGLGQPGQIAAGGCLLGQKSVGDALKAQPVHHGQALMTSDKDRQAAGACAAPVVGSKFQTEFMQLVNQRSETDEQSYPGTGTESHPYLGHSASNEPGETSALRLQTPPGDLSSSQSTYVKPLPPGNLGPPQHKTEPMEEEEDEFIFKKPFNENEDYFRVCQYCGYTSKNFKRCEGCKRVFQGEVKIHSLKRQPPKPISSAPGPIKSSPSPKPTGKESVRKKGPAGQNVKNGSPHGKGRGRGDRSGRTKGGGVRGRMGARGKSGEASEDSGTDDSLVGKKRSSDGSGSSSDGSGKKRPARPRAKNATPRKRSKKTDEPVTVTISSDEDEPSSTSSNMANHTPSPASSAGSESPLFPSTPSEPVTAFGRFRRVLMEDEEGQSKLSKKIQQQVVAPMMGRFEDEDDDEDEDEDGDEPPTYEIDIRSVRIGSMRTQPEGPLLINLQGICFKVRSERTEEAFECEILAQDVEQVKFFSGQTQPVLFLFLTPESGDMLRNICHMAPGDDEFFDPSSTDMKQKMVVIIIECFNYMPNEMLRETLSLWADMNHVEDETFIEELTEESANDLLIQSAPAVLTADVERDIVKFKRRYLRDANNMSSMPKIPGSPSDSTDNEPDSTSSSPPDIRQLLGSSIRLLQYPPPPARGIPITTEDLFCLTEGEFLNDVIIDFYLQYLYQEKLSEENRKRTHIFSSFFYKRLTQRDRHTDKTEEDAKKSLPERRHARVKKWTKTVDLFTKDFIVVPINEHSHWYLAVICFPGLANSEVVPFIPSNAPRMDFDDESNDNNGEEKPVEDNSNQDSLPRTILGKQLDAKQCLDNEDSRYNLGQKQPCILMFDSLAGPSRTPNVKMLREYLQCEWNAKRSEPRNIAKILRGSTPKVPQQSNYSDCGVYLLQYVESFFEDPIADFQIPMKGLQNWFLEELVHNKRKDIHELIMSLHRRYQEGRGDPNILDIKFESAPREQLMKFHPNPEMYAGFSRDDESSNSSVSGEMSRAELLSAAMGMDNSSPAYPQGQFGHQFGGERHQDLQQGSSEDHDANENDNTNEKHRGSNVQPRE